MNDDDDDRTIDARAAVLIIATTAWGMRFPVGGGGGGMLDGRVTWITNTWITVCYMLPSFEVNHINSLDLTKLERSPPSCLPSSCLSLNHCFLFPPRILLAFLVMRWT